MFDILFEYFALAMAKKTGGKTVGYWAGARRLFWAVPLSGGLVLLWQYFA